MALYRVNMNATSMIYNSYRFCVNITKLDLQKRQTTVKNEQFSLKYMSSGMAKGRLTLQNYITRRKSEASRSIIVQVASVKSCKDLLLYCANLGGLVEKVYFYTLPKQHVDGSKKENTFSRLIYHGKSTNIDEKQHIHAFMGVLADAMKYIIPGIFNVRKIFNARVPIIKFQNFFTHTECDLSMSNTIATYMSELLFLYGEEDDRVRPLIFTIRKWAEDNKLTSIHPGKTITNFSLTLLVIFYLQQVEILPAINSITSFSEISNNGQNNMKKIYTHYTPNYLKSYRKNNMHLSALLIDFFKFYATFDFNVQKICLRTGTTIKSIHNTALYICNPFETELNVSKNVSCNEVQRIQSLMSVAISNLQNTKASQTKKWGILSILNFPESPNLSINVLKIFDKDTNTENTRDDRTITNIQENDVSDTLNREANHVITNKNLM
ncbi:PREDICTED: poly(A) RNA polymerase, mitochondrial-like isoform X2 [Polistes canadensis]|uniref:poly(A) RNA polymerase, mitochondrial-like isoform X2 n=1 Tax=Polistes canadensis TaxID=91411 RepID=UPI000718E0EA|nr:PREDICTED: poly(A) RNA polymerase, mitochondrial-like isoform X2 [Polistes canadensis]